MSDVADRVKKIVVEHLGVDEGKVTENASFIDDLGADSLDTVELVMAFEKEFDIDIPDEEAEKLRTVGDAMSYLHEYANRRHQKTLRSYAGPYDLRRMDPSKWIMNGRQCWDVGSELEDLKHIALVTPRQAKRLRLRDPVERRAGAVVQYRRPRR